MMNADVTRLTTALVERKTRPRTLQQQQRLWGWIFLAPWIIGFLAFTAFPLVASLLFSFTDLTIGQETHWIGLANWKAMLTDPFIYTALSATLRFGALLMPLSIGFPLCISTLLSSDLLKWKRVFRALFLMPFAVPSLSSIFIWQGFLNGDTGWLDRILRLIGISNPPHWLSSSPYIQTALLMIQLWSMGNLILILIVAMQGVPTELYEAASVDGAGRLRKWRHITLPMISPVLLFNVVIASIVVLQYFNTAFILNNGDENYYFMNMYLYHAAISWHQIGYASAIGWFILLLGLVITGGLFISARRWVHYMGGD